MSEADKVIMADWECQYYAAMLASHMVSGHLNFRYKEYRINYSDYKKVASLIGAGSISLYRFKWIIGQNNKIRKGVFKTKEDSIGLNQITDAKPYLPNSGQAHSTRVMARLKQFGLLVHEATHAIQDMNLSWGMSKGEREMMAHLAEAICLLGFGEELLDSKKMKAAMPIAKKIRNREKVFKYELLHLENVLRDIYGADWEQIRQGDGILTFE